MMQFIDPPLHQPLSEAERELRERELKRDFTAPIPVFYIVASIAFVLILIVAIVGASVFHFW